MSPRLLSADARTETLDVEIPAGSSVLAGTPTARYRELESGDLGEVGIWQMTAGTVDDVESDEVFVVLAGSAELTVDDGDALSLRPGSVVRLHAGDRVRWHVTEPLRKVYVQLTAGV